MFKNYFKTAWRNLVRNKMHSFINIAGLSVGMAVAILIGLWIWDEVSFNSSFNNHKKLAQVMVTQVVNNEWGTDNSCAVPPASALRTKYPTDFKYVSLMSADENHLLTVGEKKLPTVGRWTEHDFPEMFTLKMLEGSRDALRDPSSVVLSRSMAKALFGDTNALNQVLTLDNKHEFKVAGVYEDFPRNTEFYAVKFLLPWTNKNNWAATQTNWGNHCALIYVQLTDNANFEKTTAKIKGLPTPYIKEWKEEFTLQAANTSVQ